MVLWSLINFEKVDVRHLMYAFRSSIKARVFGNPPDRNLQKYMGIAMAPSAPSTKVCNEEIARRKREVDNNPALSNDEKANEKKVPTHHHL